MTRAFARSVAASIAAAAALTPAATPAPATLVKAPLPPVLSETESGAEDIVDYALTGERSKVVAAAARMKAAAPDAAAAALTRGGVPARTVALLEQRANHLAQIARSGSFVEILLAANAVSQLMPALYAHFEDPVPAPILTLDYLDREARFRSLARQPQKVAAAVADLEQTWVKVRPRVIAAGGASQVAAYDHHVAAMKRLEPGAGKKVQAEAVRGLELVDELENVFTS